MGLKNDLFDPFFKIKYGYVLNLYRSLTVDTVTQTQAPSQHSEDEDGVGFLARDDASR